MTQIDESELHLFIIWEKARYKEKEILKDLKESFTLLNVYEITWSNEKFSENLSRFYGAKLPKGSLKEKHCGKGDFLLIITEDKNPEYMNRKTSKGTELVNIKTFDAKTRYRNWTGGGHKIHGTNSLTETNHDLTLLLGSNTSDYLLTKKDWDGNVIKIKDNILGSDGWSNIEELFYVLNNTIDYVVLRNFECLPDQYNLENHGDIDLLTNNYNDMEWILNGVKVFNKSYRVHYRVNIDNKDVLFDIRFQGDNYYDSSWEKKIIDNRVLAKDCFYVPDSLDYYYSLLYHAIIHKRKVSLDYSERLWNMDRELGISNESLESYRNPFYLKSLLDIYMHENEYSYTEPKDLSVYFNQKLLQTKISYKRIINQKVIKRLHGIVRRIKTKNFRLG